MLLNHINHKMPIYKDCTLVELLAVSIGYLVIGGLVLSLLTRLLTGYGCIGFALVLVSLLHVTRFILGRLQRLKYGKPYGHYQQLLMKKLMQTPGVAVFLQARLVTRLGIWSVRRMS